ncbi:hypothetical protein ABIC22_001018 [Paenibacillus sp. PvP094]
MSVLSEKMCSIMQLYRKRRQKLSDRYAMERFASKSRLEESNHHMLYKLTETSLDGKEDSHEP